MRLQLIAHAASSVSSVPARPKKYLRILQVVINRDKLVYTRLSGVALVKYADLKQVGALITSLGHLSRVNTTSRYLAPRLMFL